MLRFNSHEVSTADYPLCCASRATASRGRKDPPKDHGAYKHQDVVFPIYNLTRTAWTLDALICGLLPASVTARHSSHASCAMPALRILSVAENRPWSVQQLTAIASSNPRGEEGVTIMG